MGCRLCLGPDGSMEGGWAERRGGDKERRAVVPGATGPKGRRGRVLRGQRGGPKQGDGGALGGHGPVHIKLKSCAASRPQYPQHRLPPFLPPRAVSPSLPRPGKSFHRWHLSPHPQVSFPPSLSPPLLYNRAGWDAGVQGLGLGQHGQDRDLALSQRASQSLLLALEKLHRVLRREKGTLTSVRLWAVP